MERSFGKGVHTGVVAVFALLLVVGYGSARHGETRAVASSYSYFLDLPGITGDATEPGHVGDVTLTGFSWGENEPGFTRSTLALGKVDASSMPMAHDLHAMINTSKVTPQLFAIGTSNSQTKVHFFGAILSVRKDGDNFDMIQWKFDDFGITSYKTFAMDGGASTDDFGFTFAKANVEVRSSSIDPAPAHAAWNFRDNSAWTNVWASLP